MFIRPEIDEGNEREQFSTWEWGIDNIDRTPLEKAAIQGANVILDQIKSDAVMFVTPNSPDKVNVTINLFGDYYLCFDITEQLRGIQSDIYDIGFGRKPLQQEVDDMRKLADLFCSIGSDLLESAKRYEDEGVLQSDPQSPSPTRPPNAPKHPAK